MYVLCAAYGNKDAHCAVRKKNQVKKGVDERYEILVRSSRVVIERQTANTKFATVLASIPASSDTEESEGQQMMKPCRKKYLKKKYPPFTNFANVFRRH
jgi:hypothetical protein